MDKTSLLELLENPKNINRNKTNEIQQVLEKYPYFQSLSCVYLKLLYANNHPLYNLNLKKVAAHTSDREILFDFITEEEFEQIEVAKQVKKISNESKESEDNHFMDLATAEKITSPDLFEKPKVENLSNKKENLNFDQTDKLSFNEWLKITKMKPIKRKSPKTNLKETEEHRKKFNLIDNFLANNPKIDAKKEMNKTKKINPKTQPSSQLMTETLAKVYEEQNRYDKAIQAYNILILNNPEKSGLFANQIERIKQIIEKE